MARIRIYNVVQCMYCIRGRTQTMYAPKGEGELGKCKLYPYRVKWSTKGG